MALDINYLLEVERNDVLGGAFLLPIVTHYTPRTDFPVEIERAFGNIPIREHSEVVDHYIHISGVSGYAHRLGTDRNAQALFASGPDLFLEFRAFLIDYVDKAARARAKDPEVLGDDGSADFRLVFRAIYEEEDYYVEPVSLTPRRDEDSHLVDYGYDLVLRAWGPAKRKAKGILGTARDVAKQATKAIDSVTAYVAVGNSYVADLRSTASAFRGPVNAVLRLGQQVQVAVSQVETAGAVAATALQDIFSVVESATRTLYAAWDAFPASEQAAGRELLEGALADLGAARREALHALGMSYKRSAGYGTGAGDPSYAQTTALGLTAVDGRLVVPHQVTAGDTLRSLALKYLGRADRWGAIAELNGLTSAHAIGPGTAVGPGSIIYVPIPPGDAPVDRLHGAQLYGVDLKLEGGDLAIRGGPGGTDWVVVRGLDNLDQAVTLRAQTPRGALRYAPGFGLRPSIDAGGPGETLGLMAADIRSQYTSDPRIERVTEIELIEDGDTLAARMLIHPVAGVPVRTTTPTAQEA